MGAHNSVYGTEHLLSKSLYHKSSNIRSRKNAASVFPDSAMDQKNLAEALKKLQILGLTLRANESKSLMTFRGLQIQLSLLPR